MCRHSKPAWEQSETKSRFRSCDTNILARTAADDAINDRNFAAVYLCDISQMFRILVLLSNLTFIFCVLSKMLRTSHIQAVCIKKR